jgi:hypothetical protein
MRAAIVRAMSCTSFGAKGYAPSAWGTWTLWSPGRSRSFGGARRSSGGLGAVPIEESGDSCEPLLRHRRTYPLPSSCPTSANRSAASRRSRSQGSKAVAPGWAAHGALVGVQHAGPTVYIPRATWNRRTRDSPGEGAPNGVDARTVERHSRKIPDSPLRAVPRFTTIETVPRRLRDGGRSQRGRRDVREAREGVPSMGAWPLAA